MSAGPPKKEKTKTFACTSLQIEESAESRKLQKNLINPKPDLMKTSSQ